VKTKTASAWSANSIVERFGLVVAWIIIIVIFGILSPTSFLTWGNFSSMFGSQAVLVVLTLGLLFVLRSGDFDLAIAATLTMSSMTLGVLNVELHVNIGLSIVAALLIGVLVGAINAFLAVRLKIDSFIATLGTATVLQGIALWISDSNTITGVSSWLIDATAVPGFLGIAPQFYYGLIVCVIVFFVFQFTVFGRELLFVGQNRDVARLSGLRVGRLRTISFIACGFLSALAGVLYSGTTGGANPTSGLSFMLPAFAAAFLGATNFTPGHFNPWGSFVALYLLVTGVIGLAILGVPTFVQNIFYGGALILAVSFSIAAKNRRSRPRTMVETPAEPATTNI
jgi:ribose transport system permease protein